MLDASSVCERERHGIKSSVGCSGDVWVQPELTEHHLSPTWPKTYSKTSAAYAIQYTCRGKLHIGKTEGELDGTN